MSQQKIGQITVVDRLRTGLSDEIGCTAESADLAGANGYTLLQSCNLQIAARAIDACELLVHGDTK
jgi:hypothetical protein